MLRREPPAHGDELRHLGVSPPFVAGDAPAVQAPEAAAPGMEVGTVAAEPADGLVAHVPPKDRVGCHLTAMLATCDPDRGLY